MPAKSRIQWREIPHSKTSAKIRWIEGVDPPYETPQQVKPWLDAAWALALKQNPSWKTKGVPVDFWGTAFSVDDIKGSFRVFGISGKSSPKAKVVWTSPWSNTTWSMYLDIKKVEYDPETPVKNG